MKRTIKLNFCDFKNFGDALCPYLIRHLTGCDVVASNVNYADLQAVGSVFYDGGQFFGEKGRFINRNYVKDVYHKVRNMFRKPMIVWGSGFLDATEVPLTCSRYRDLDIRAVRGKITECYLRKAGYRITPNVALGDPGILYPDLLNGLSDIPKRYDLAIIASYNDRPLGEKLKERVSALGVRVRTVDVMQSDPLQTIRDIATANKVVASAMHAMIVADALGIPNVLMSFPRYNPFKTRDYFSSYGMEIPAILDFRYCMENPASILKSIPDTPYVSRDQVAETKQTLLKAFPQ